jgi:hypothetical protein
MKKSINIINKIIKICYVIDKAKSHLKLKKQ